MLSSTRIALQVTLAIFISEVIMHFSHLEKSYWCPMTILYLFSSGQGESNSRAIYRLLTTIVAGILGTLFGVIFHPNYYGYLIIIFFCTYLMFYYLLRSYAWSGFYGAFLIVFLYCSIDSWSVGFLAMRFYETGMGAVIVILVSLFFPIKENCRLQTELISLLELINNRIEVIKVSLECESSEFEIHSFSQLIGVKKKIHSIINNIRYENVFKQKRYFVMLRLKKTLNVILFELENLYISLESSSLSKEELKKYESALDMLIEYNRETIAYLKLESKSELSKSDAPRERLEFEALEFLGRDNQDRVLDKSKIQLHIRSLLFQQDLMTKWIEKIVEHR